VIPSEHFNTVLWTGIDDTNRSFTGVGFSPSLVWAKRRNATSNHLLWDSVRGGGKELKSNTTDTEQSNNSYGYLSSFDSDGFSTVNGGSQNTFNVSGSTFVAWNWKANGAGVSNTSGTITSTVSANADAGFSIVKYTGTGVQDASVGHGLSKRPDMLIIKERNGSNAWLINHSSMAFTESLFFDTAAKRTGIDYFGDTDMTATVFHTDSGNSNVNATTFIAYCFHSVDGYSKVGSYKGNGSSDGTFVYTGFRPMMILYKSTDNVTHWSIHNTESNPYNVADTELHANENASEATANEYKIDILSNGFKQRNTNGTNNGNGYNYIFIAFAESPFKHTNAR